MKKCLFVLCLIFVALFISCNLMDPAISEDITQQTGTVTGKVVYANALDNSNIKVTLEKVTSPVSKALEISTKSSTSRTTSIHTAVESDGTFIFEDVEPGTYTLYASSPSSTEKAIQSNVVVKSGEGTSINDLQLTATGNITGTIKIDNQSTGNSGIIVFIPSTSYISITDDSGEFTLNGIPAGQSYQISVLRGLYSENLFNVTVVANETVLLSSTSLDSSAIASGNESFVWKGSYKDSSSLSSLSKNWAYYNTTDGCSYIYNGTEWTLLTRAGKDGSNGKDGVDGKNGVDGTGLLWKGSFESAPSSPMLNWLYFNTTDGNTYIFDGSKWALFARAGSDGKDGSNGTNGIDGKNGVDGVNGRGIYSVSFTYAITSTQTQPESITETTIPTLSSTNKYLWQKTTFTYTDASETSNIALIAVYGDTGTAGEDGVDGKDGNNGKDGELGHTLVKYEAVAPTCTKSGLTEGYYCNHCSKWITAQQEVSATGHVKITDAAIEATCEHDGYSEGSHCSVCNEVLVAQIKTTDALNHDFDEDGCCNVCGTWVTVGVKGPAGGWIFYDVDADNANGNADGLTSEQCGWKYLEFCEEITTGTLVADKVYANLTNAYNEEDCTKLSIGSGYSNTQNLWKKENKYSKKPDTNIVLITKIVNFGGYSDWFIPSIDELEALLAFVKETELETIDTSKNYISSSAASRPQDYWQYNNGKRTTITAYSFLTFNTFYVRAIDSNGRHVLHNPDFNNLQLENNTAPCSNTTGYYLCKECEEHTYGHIISEASHNFGDWQTIEEASCLSAGLRQRTCLDCGTVESEVVPVTDHAGEWKCIRPVTCIYSGYYERECTVCHTTETKTMSATGHAFGEYETKITATCDHEGVEVAICENCGLEKSRTINCLSHKDVFIEKVNPTCTEEGYIRYQCSSCDHIHEEVLEATGHTYTSIASLGNITYCTTCHEAVFGPTGGVIFYDVDADNDNGNADGLVSTSCGWRYLEACPVDLPSRYYFGYYSTDSVTLSIVNGTKYNIGSGYDNTSILATSMKNCSYMRNSKNKLVKIDSGFVACQEFTYRGYDDWFVPSRDELKLMIDSGIVKNRSMFVESEDEARYLTSSEYDVQYFEGYFGTLEQSLDRGSYADKKFAIRPIRTVTVDSSGNVVK